MQDLQENGLDKREPEVIDAQTGLVCLPLGRSTCRTSETSGWSWRTSTGRSMPGGSSRRKEQGGRMSSAR
jgi:hypothetical protein